MVQLIETRDSFYERRFNTKTTSQSDPVRTHLQKILLLNMGLKPEDVETSEKYAELSDKLPHIVPDFMKILYNKYRFNLYNFSVEIEGKSVNLGPVEMIHCQRLRNIQTWPKVGIHKLIFKPFLESKTNYPLAREIKVNRRLFPKILGSNQNKTSKFYMVLMIFDDRFRLLKEKFIHLKSFNKHGWLSIDISNDFRSSVFYLKTFGLWKKYKTSFRRVYDSHSQIKLTPQLYPYYANIVTFYKNKSPSKSYRESVLMNSNSGKLYQSRPKRDLSHYSLGQEEDCQRHPLIVTFKEVGWSKWIIAPQNYNAYYCKGNCPYPLSDNFNATNHAIIQLLVHGLKDLTIPKPCCVPYHLQPETLLYLNNDGDALLREFKDMSVSSCSCR